MPKLTHKAFEKYGFAAATLITDWAMIVGKDIAGYTAPERLKWPRGVGIRDDVADGAEGRPGATLIVRVEPARALDVQYKAQQIIERINGYFGYRAIAELRILQAPLPRARRPPPQPRLAAAALRRPGARRHHRRAAAHRAGEPQVRADERAAKRAEKPRDRPPALSFIHLERQRVLPYSDRSVACYSGV